MLEERGDLWSFADDYKCVTTNGVIDKNKCLVMGAGVALQAKLRFPSLPAILGNYVSKYGNRPFILQSERLITFPTKHHWSEKSDLKLIETSALRIVDIVNRYGIKKVYTTRPGCGLGGRSWEKEVKPILEKIFGDRFTVLLAKEE